MMTTLDIPRRHRPFSMKGGDGFLDCVNLLGRAGVVADPPSVRLLCGHGDLDWSHEFKKVLCGRAGYP